LIICESTQLFLAGLFRDPEELRGFGVDAGDQLVKIKQKSFGWGVHGIYYRVGTASKVGELFGCIGQITFPAMTQWLLT
jgi:hypothetical protein